MSHIKFDHEKIYLDGDSIAEFKDVPTYKIQEFTDTVEEALESHDLLEGDEFYISRKEYDLLEDKHRYASDLISNLMSVLEDVETQDGNMEAKIQDILNEAREEYEACFHTNLEGLKILRQSIYCKFEDLVSNVRKLTQDNMHIESVIEIINFSNIQENVNIWTKELDFLYGLKAKRDKEGLSTDDCSKRDSILKSVLATIPWEQYKQLNGVL